MSAMSALVGSSRTSAAPLRAIAIGARAAHALASSDGRLTPLAQFPQAPYMYAGSEIVWIGVRARSLHPRMIVLDDAAPLQQALRIDASHLDAWTPMLPRIDAVARGRLIRSAIDLHARIRDVAVPRGFGTLLVGTTPTFPLDLATPRVERFITALVEDDRAQIEAHGCALLGVGTGLTPSGDDLVGAALFARKLIAQTDTAHAAQDALAQRMVAQAKRRTHIISAALFADLAAGASYGLLHDVVDALLRGTIDSAVERARSLVAIGHSSGWDMLTGLIAALTAQAPDRIRIGIDTHD